MSVICAGALVVAGGMTVVAYKKQSQEIGSPQVVNSANIAHEKSKLPNLKTVNEIALYYNGTRVDGLLAFSTSKGELLFPIDDLFNYIGAKYTYHSADGIVEASINDSNIILKIASDIFTVNGLEKQLPFAVTLSNDRIMVPVEVLNSINGFSASGKTNISTAYANYNPDYLARAFKDIFYVAATNQIEGIYSIDGKRFINMVDISEDLIFDYSPAKKSVLYINNGGAFLLSKDMDFVSVDLNMGGETQWSDDMKTIYEPLNDFSSLKIYNLDNGKSRVLENVRQTITSNKDFEDFSSGILRLVSYWNYDKTTRISVLNTKTNNVCTIVYNAGSPIIVAKAWLSPTGKYMTYIKDGDYRLCAFDGSQDIALGKAVSMKWVTDDVIMLLKNGEWQAYNMNGTIKSYKDSDLKFLSVVDGSTILFQDSNSIYKSVDGIEEKVVDIGINLDSAISTPNINSIIADDQEKNALYLISGSVYTKIGEYAALLKNYDGTGMVEDLQRSVKISPNGKLICVAQLGKDSVALKIMASDGSWTKELKFDSDAYMRSRYGSADVDFLDNNKIVFNDQSYIWLIDLGQDDPLITKIPESYENIYIKGVMVK